MTHVTINNGGGDPGFPHMIHFVLTLLTCGLWLPVWVMLWLLSRLM